MKMDNMVKKISIFAIVCMMVLMAVPVQTVEAANKSPQIIVKNSSGKVYLPTDLCNLYQSAEFGCTYGENTARVFTGNTTVSFKNADKIEVYGIDVIQEGKNHVVKFVDPVLWSNEENGLSKKGKNLKCSNLKNRISELLYNVDVMDRYGNHIMDTGDTGSFDDVKIKFSKNGTDYTYDMYIIYAANSKADRFIIDCLVPKGSNAIKYVKKKETYKYQNIQLSKNAERYDSVRLDWDKIKIVDTTKKDGKLALNAKAKGKISYAEIVGDWYTLPDTDKGVKKKLYKYYGDKKNAEKKIASASVSKKGVVSFKRKSYDGCSVLIKAGAKGKYATTYRRVFVNCEYK